MSKSKQERALATMNEAIAQLHQERIDFDQLTPYHLKVDDWNFWPSTGLIRKDGAASGLDEKGIDAFIQLVRPPIPQRSPQPAPVPRPSVAPASPTSSEPVRRMNRFLETMSIAGSGELLATPESLAARNRTFRGYRD